MKKIDIHHNAMTEVISVMKEVVEWGRSKGYRVWLDE